MKHMIGKVFLQGAGLLFMSCTMLTGGCSDPKKEAGNKAGNKAMIVAGMVMQPRELSNILTTTGTILANEEVELRSETSGRIVSLHFEEGSAVARGALLLKTDDRELRAQLRRLELEEKQAADDLFRKEKLLELKAVSQEEYDQSANSLAIIRAQADLVKVQISKTEITAPFSGIVGLRLVSPGGYISSATLIGRLQQTDPVKIDFSVPEKYRGKIAPGHQLSFALEGIDSLFQARIYAIEPKVDPATRTFQARARCENGKGIITPGAFARISIVLEKFPGTLVIPSESLIPQLNSEKVYVVRNGKAVSQVIRTGIRTEREVQVLEGLAAGDTVVTSGLLQVRDGADIKVRTSR